MKQAYSGAGYSPASFGLGDSTSNATATEIKQQQSKSFKTSAKKAKYWTSTLEDMFYWMLQVDNYAFGSNNADYKVQVNIQDSVQTDPMQKADSINKLVQAKAMSIDTTVRQLHPEWNEKQVENEVNRIMQENGMAVNEPDDLVQKGVLKISKYRKKPVVIEAVEWNGANNLITETFMKDCKDAYIDYSNKQLGEVVIPTLEGVMRANVGDYIIKGVNGEFYPCKPDIFHKTYEKV